MSRNKVWRLVVVVGVVVIVVGSLWRVVVGIADHTRGLDAKAAVPDVSQSIDPLAKAAALELQVSDAQQGSAHSKAYVRNTYGLPAGECGRIYLAADQLGYSSVEGLSEKLCVDDEYGIDALQAPNGQIVRVDWTSVPTKVVLSVER